MATSDLTVMATSAGALGNVAAVTRRHDDGRACAAGMDSLLCALIAHPATTVEDIESRRYGHAQFECAYALLEAKSYAKLTAYLWCVLPHCPTATACVFPHWEERRCTSEVHNLLGFAYSRSESTSAEEYREKGYAHYHAALTLAPDNFGAWGYLAQLYVLCRMVEWHREEQWQMTHKER